MEVQLSQTTAVVTQLENFVFSNSETGSEQTGYYRDSKKGNWLLPGGYPASNGYLGREVFMAVMACRNERRKKYIEGQ
jgi:hypothetical protein